MLFSRFASALIGAVMVVVCPLIAVSAHGAKPIAVLFAGEVALDHQTPNLLVADGMVVGQHGSLRSRALTWDEVKDYNVLVLAGLGISASDGSLTASNKTTLKTVRRFMDEGGGVLFFPFWVQMEAKIPPQNALVNPLGLKLLFDDVVFDSKTQINATAWRVDMAHTDKVPASPISEGVQGLWYPVATRVGAQVHTVPLDTDKHWNVLVTGSNDSLTRRVSRGSHAVNNLKAGTEGTFSTRVPLIASRQVGKGRMVVYGISPQWLYGRYSRTTLESIVPDRGLEGKASGGYALLINAIKWLGKPSQKQGNLGGAPTDQSLLANPYLTKYIAPTNWKKLEQNPLPAMRGRWNGVIGARTKLTGGTGDVAQWVEAAKAQKLRFLVFLEDFSQLTPDKLETFKAQCAKVTDQNFAAIPGFVIDDEVGNHYFYFGSNIPYPAKELISEPGGVFVSYDPGGFPNAPHTKGQLSTTTLKYVNGDASHSLTAGGFRFNDDALPFTNGFCNFDAMGVLTYQDGQLVEDMTEDYLKVVDAGQAPLPLVVDIMTSPKQLADTSWRTVVHVGNGGSDEPNEVMDFFNHFHFYPNNPARIYVTQGPMIHHWSYVGPRDYEGANKGDFVWQNYRWRIGGKVSSKVGIKEVALYDGPTLFRRFLPQGEKRFEFTLDLTHDKQHTLVMMVTDINGNRAISRDHWDRNHRLQEFNCSDRNNQLSYGYITRSDGTGIQLGGNAANGTPNKRIPQRHIGPAAVFKTDALLGAPAFDGAATGDPEVFLPVMLHPKDGSADIKGPTVGEAFRQFISGDVHIGESHGRYVPTDGNQSLNVWHSLWSVEPSPDMNVDLRTLWFQIDPDHPLNGSIKRLRITLNSDRPNQGMTLGFIRGKQAKRWVVRSSDDQVWFGEAGDSGARKNHEQPFGAGAYLAMLDSPLGSSAVFSLTDGLEVRWASPSPDRISIYLPADQAPQRKGESCEIDLLFAGIPRRTDYTQAYDPSSHAFLDRFREQMGLSQADPDYVISPRQGIVIDQQYLLQVDGRASQAFVGELEGDLMTALPMSVSGLNDQWSAFLYDDTVDAARPVGVFEGSAWATIPLHGKKSLFVGHPVTCDQPQAILQLTQVDAKAWTLEVHNPADQPMRVKLAKNPMFSPFKGMRMPSKPLEVPAGASVPVNIAR